MEKVVVKNSKGAHWIGKADVLMPFLRQIDWGGGAISHVVFYLNVSDRNF